MLPEAEAAFEVAGAVHTLGGEPVEGLTIRSSEGESVKTSADGSYRLKLSASTWIHPVELTSQPRRVAATEPAEGLDFLVPDLCPVTVEVVDEHAEPLDATLLFSVYSEGFPFTSSRSVETVDGHHEFPLAACGRVSLLAVREGYGTVEHRDEHTGPRRIELTLGEGTRVWGTFTTPAGDPIDGAVWARFRELRGEVDAEGVWEIHLASGRDWRLVASPAEAGWLGETRSVHVPEGAEELRVDFVARSFRLVEVYCAGLPDDSCETVVPILCTHPLSPVGELCESYATTTCVCPEGQVALRGGGQAVEVGPDEDAAWLDFRSPGGLRGVVWRDETPFRCWYGAARMPEGVDEVLGGGTHARTGSCEDDGTFEILGLEEGRWVVEIYSTDGRWPQDDVYVEGTVVDLGDIDLSEGGAITVTVYDGLTGEPAAWEAVLANLRDRDSVNPVGHGGMSDSEGVVEMTGLPPGVYDVFLARRPLEVVTLGVEDDSALQVVLETGEADLLDENGFAVARTADGELEIAELEPGGAAEDNGLAEGDVIVGVVVMGMDVLAWAPQYADEATRWVLDNYSGPGVDLVVERDDGLHDIPLQ